MNQLTTLVITLYGWNSCLFAGPTCIQASPRIFADTSPCRYLESIMNVHMARVASARASRRGRTSFREATGGGWGRGTGSGVLARRLTYGFGGGMYGLVYGSSSAPVRALDLGERTPKDNLKDASSRLNLCGEYSQNPHSQQMYAMTLTVCSSLVRGIVSSA